MSEDAALGLAMSGVQVVDAMAVDAVGVVAEVREESHMAIDRAACGVF